MIARWSQSVRRWSVGLAASAGFIAWFVVSSVIVSTLMVGHWVTLPKPERLDTWVALRTLRTTDAPLMAVHVLYADCECSRRIFDHLVTSKRPSNTEEVVLLVGRAPDFETHAAARGLRIHRIKAPSLKQDYGIEAAPLLAVLSDQKTEYLGGYTDRKQGPDIRDVEIIEALAENAAAKELPLFGCGVSAELQVLLDPLKVKY